jgi:hypothetical protein
MLFFPPQVDDIFVGEKLKWKGTVEGLSNGFIVQDVVEQFLD